MSKSELIAVIHVATARAVAARDAASEHAGGCEIARRDAEQGAVARAAWRAVGGLPARWREAVRNSVISGTIGPYWPVFQVGPKGIDIKKAFYARIMREVEAANP